MPRRLLHPRRQLLLPRTTDRTTAENFVRVRPSSSVRCMRRESRFDPITRLIALVVIALGANACAAANPFRLGDQVALFTDDLRWGRLPAAETQIAPSLRAAFSRRHRSWGHALQIMDVEVDETRVNGLVGTVHTRYTWMLRNEMDTRETVVETRWRAAGMSGDWTCEDEHIVAGDPALLASR